MNTSTVAWNLLSDPNNATAANKSDWRKNTGSAEKNNTLTGSIEAQTHHNPCASEITIKAELWE
jgi:hypothetical protein